MIEIWLPAELTGSKEGDNFWAATNTATADQNFVMYSFPYKDKDTFTKEYFIHKRDSDEEEHSRGSKEGMYMTTDSAMVNRTPH